MKMPCVCEVFTNSVSKRIGEHKDNDSLQRNVKGFTKAFGRNAIQFLISVEGYNQ